MTIGVPKEIHAGERRVAMTPAVVGELRKIGFSVAVESGAGAAAGFDDAAYHQAGAVVSPSAHTPWSTSDIILKVRPPELDLASAQDEVDLLRPGQTLVCFLWPGQNPDLLQRIARTGATTLAMDSVPRISRAQKMDALSSMANVAGYRAVVEAAQHFGRFFTGQVTAAGRIAPAKVLVIGAGVAGLAAIGAARSLGAVVRAFDSRPEVKEQVKSLAADFLELDVVEEGAGAGGYAKVMSPAYIKAEMALFARQAADVDIIITTALIPGKRAPTLITADMVSSMKPGSVIVDLAAEQGGNCELTTPNAVVRHHGVTIIGYTDLPSRMAAQSSELYATNLRHLLTELCPGREGVLDVDMEDEVIRGATAVKDGTITWPPPPRRSAAPAKAPVPAAPALPVRTSKRGTSLGQVAGLGVAALALLGLGLVAPPDLMAHVTVFVLACVVGYLVVWNVTPALHTPLMSVTNAISSIIIIGALLQVSSSEPWIAGIAAFTIALTSINIAGGFAVTRRMLAMFQR